MKFFSLGVITAESLREKRSN